MAKWATVSSPPRAPAIPLSRCTVFSWSYIRPSICESLPGWPLPIECHIRPFIFRSFSSSNVALLIFVYPLGEILTRAPASVSSGS
jgi:hypothetical protein